MTSDFPVRVLGTSNVSSSSSSTVIPSLSSLLYSSEWSTIETLFNPSSTTSSTTSTTSNPSFIEQCCIPDQDGRTPFQWAVAGGRYETVRNLLHSTEIIQKNVVNLPDLHTGITPLMSATAVGNNPLIQLLLDMGADPNVQISSRFNKDHDANGDDEITTGAVTTTTITTPRYTFSFLSSSSNSFRLPPVVKNNRIGTSTLHFHKGKINVLEILIPVTSVVCLNSHDISSGATPLHRCVGSGYRAAAEYLLNHGANINAVDNEGNTPLHYAIEENQRLMVQLFLDYKADVQLQNKEGKSCTDLCTTLKTVTDDVRILMKEYQGK